MLAWEDNLAPLAPQPGLQSGVPTGQAGGSDAGAGGAGPAAGQCR